MGLFAWVSTKDPKKELIISGLKDSILIFVLMFLWSIVSFVVNGGGELIYIKTLLTLVSSVLGSYLIARYSTKVCCCVDDCIFYVCIAIFAESVYTVMLRFVPGLYDITYSFLVNDMFENHQENFMDLYRLVGLGDAKYFGVVKTATPGIFLSMYLISINYGRKIVNIIIYITISLVSFLVARTSAIPIALSILFLLFSKRRKRKTVLAVICVLAVLGLSMFWALKQYLPEGMFAWAFYDETTGESSAVQTAQSLLELTNSFDLSVKTIIFGDARYSGETPDTYYMHTDVGYSRIIFYGGIFGLLLTILFQWSFVKNIKKCGNKSLYAMGFFLFISYLFTLYKGDISFASSLVLINIFFAFERKSSVNCLKC